MQLALEYFGTCAIIKIDFELKRRAEGLEKRAHKKAPEAISFASLLFLFEAIKIFFEDIESIINTCYLHVCSQP